MERVRRCGLVGRSGSLGVGFGVSKALTSLSAAQLPASMIVNFDPLKLNANSI